MRRREFIAVVGGAALALPLVARAQGPKKLVGMLRGVPDPKYLQAFTGRLNELGWVEGDNLQIEVRSDPNPDRQRELAVELVRMKVDVIFAGTSAQVEATRQATKTIPIVFAAHGDPVGAGHVDSLARPGGNATGLTNLATELTAKGLDVLKDLNPTANVVGYLWDPAAPTSVPVLKSVETAATNIGVRLHMAPVRSAEEFDGALSSMANAGVQAFLGASSPLTYNKRVELAELALKHRFASVFSARDNAVVGALMSYGPDFEDLIRRGANYVDKILRGANPADLPVEQASKYVLVLNLKTAKTLGLTIPPTLLARADEVIE